MTDEERYAKIRELLTEVELLAIATICGAADETADVCESSGDEQEADEIWAATGMIANILGREVEPHEMAPLAAFMCVDCSANTHEINEYYMVHDHVWEKEASMDKEGGMLCIGCLENRIKRQLTAADFTDYPINFVFLRSERLADRLQGKSPLEMAA
ncbi:hypothetical protein [Rhizobium laguerreae]|uniref:hypothetical protein n=1 Tax=Rhizobium laguerreae TaxID=1076926 RepID=UPI001C928E3F|nr:hypothetical protein [Rhizobium laguerreae]MBY3231831.1 hypothetical protein [Rhizobium laguerreae]